MLRIIGLSEGNHRPPVDSSPTGPVMYILLLLGWTSCWTNSRVTDDVILHDAQRMPLEWFYRQDISMQFIKKKFGILIQIAFNVVNSLIMKHKQYHVFNTTLCNNLHVVFLGAWWRHDMEKISVLLSLYMGSPLVTSGFLSQRPVIFYVFFIWIKLLNKQSTCRWFETPQFTCDFIVMTSPKSYH